jgi:hypothetical protein
MSDHTDGLAMSNEPLLKEIVAGVEKLARPAD